MIRVIRIIHQNLQSQFFIYERKQTYKKKIEKDRIPSRAHTQPSSKYFGVRKRFTLIFRFVYTWNYGEPK